MTRQVVLVVDDEASARKYVSAVLKARDYDVLTAEDGTEALKRIAEHPIDLVILDIGMPGPDGMKVLAATGSRVDNEVWRGEERNAPQAPSAQTMPSGTDCRRPKAPCRAQRLVAAAGRR